MQKAILATKVLSLIHILRDILTTGTTGRS